MQGGRSILARQSKDRPIEAVELRIEFRADKAKSAAITSAIPYAEVRGNACVMKIKGSDPGEVAEKAREVLEVIRGLAERNWEPEQVAHGNPGRETPLPV